MLRQAAEERCLVVVFVELNQVKTSQISYGLTRTKPKTAETLVSHTKAGLGRAMRAAPTRGRVPSHSLSRHYIWWWFRAVSPP